MPIIQPPQPRCTIENPSSSLIITIPSRKHWLLFFNAALLFVSWVMVEIMLGFFVVNLALVSLADLLGWFGSSSSDTATGTVVLVGTISCLFTFFGVCTLSGLVVLIYPLWLLTGVERIEVEAQSLTVQHFMLKMIKLGRRRTYLAEHIKDLRVVSTGNYFWWWRGAYFWGPYSWGLTSGPIAFDYGAKTFHYGGGVDEAEAKTIVKAIHERFPQYQTRQEAASG